MHLMLTRGGAETRSKAASLAITSPKRCTMPLVIFTSGVTTGALLMYTVPLTVTVCPPTHSKVKACPFNCSGGRKARATAACTHCDVAVLPEPKQRK